MKIQGQGQPPTSGVADAPGADGAKGVAGADEVGKSTESGRAFADKLEKTDATKQAAGAAGSVAVAGGVPIGDLAAAVRAGGLTSRAAVDEIVERIVARQVGSNAPAAVREQLKATLEDALENDPLLAEKLRQLG